MLASLVITFREVLEAALVIIIISAYLKRSGQTSSLKNVWLGVGAGAALSVLIAIIFELVAGGFTGEAEKVFEAITMFIAVGLITWMIIWMMFQQRRVVKALEGRLRWASGKAGAVGITLLVAAAVLREGVEMVVFLRAASLVGGSTLAGALTGGALAVTLGYLIYAGSRALNLKHLFRASSGILILFAAGLVSHALHELVEAGVVAPIIEPLYDITWILDKKGVLGASLSSLFGYTPTPSLLEAIGYVGYFIFAYLLYRGVERVWGLRAVETP